MPGTADLRRLTTKESMRTARAHAEKRDFHIPARNVIVRSPRRILRELTSVKTGLKVPCESSVEYDHYVVLDVRRDVISFRAQPEMFLYRDNAGAVRRHYPDVRVELASGKIEIHEVKTDRDAARPELIERHRLIGEGFASRKEHFVLVVESEIRRQPRLRNAELIRSARTWRPDSETRWLIQDALAAAPLALSALEDRIGTGATARRIVLSMVLRGMLDMDWEHLPIDGNIPVSLGEPAR